MLTSHYIQALLGIKDAIITKVQNRPNEQIIDVWLELNREIHEWGRLWEKDLSYFTTERGVMFVPDVVNVSMRLIRLFLNIIYYKQTL